MAAGCVTLLRALVRPAPGFTTAHSRFCSSATSKTSSKDKKKAKTSILRPDPSPTHDWIGPPDPLSNLRPIVYRALQTETELEKRLRALRQDTEDWNHDFWAKQNVTFTMEKELFIVSQLDAKGLSRRDPDGKYASADSFMFKSGVNPDSSSSGRKRSLDSEEMAVFYKSFLDKNRIRHANYNKEWYRRNFTITLLMARVALQNFWKNFSHKGKKSSSPTT